MSPLVEVYSAVQMQSKHRGVKIYRAISSNRRIKRGRLIPTRWEKGLGERGLWIPGKHILGQDLWDTHQTCYQGELGSREGKRC